jgi:hypothetical protein
MAKSQVFYDDLKIKDCTKQLESLGMEVRRAGMRTKVYKMGLPASKWLEVGQLVGLVKRYTRYATPMELALLKVGIVRQGR